MSYIDVTGKTEEEAISKALAQLGMDRDLSLIHIFVHDAHQVAVGQDLIQHALDLADVGGDILGDHAGDAIRQDVYKRQGLPSGRRL